MPGLTPFEHQRQRDRPGDTLEREIAFEHVVVPVGPHCGGHECRDRELGDVEEIGGLNVSFTLLVAGVDRVHTSISAVTDGVPSSVIVIAPLNWSNLP
jgi:hypothetical protein